MTVTIIWTDAEREKLLAALAENAPPSLDFAVASAIHSMRRESCQEGAAESRWRLDLAFSDAQRLKTWCDARRERAAEEAPDAVWTRIVAKVNEGVQPFAPARNPAR